jgi:hypothetical protein
MDASRRCWDNWRRHLQWRCKRAAAVLAGTHSAAVLATVANLPELPDSWDLSQPGQLREALAELLMPGQWHQGHITGLSKKMPGAVGFLQPAGPGGELMPECVPTMETEVLRLLE